MVRIRRRAIRGRVAALTVPVFAVFAVFAVLAALAAGCGAPAKAVRTANVQREVPATRPASVSAFHAELPWRAPASRAAKRMLGPAPGGDHWPDYPVYYALWDAGGRAGAEPLLVAVQQNPMDLFGAIWNVQLLDRTGRVLRRGQTRCYELEEPYCLMEVRSDSPLIPAGYRGRWALAVAFVADHATEEKQRRFDEAHKRGEPVEVGWDEMPEPTEDEDGEKLPALDPSKPLYVDEPVTDEAPEGNVLTVDPVRWAEDDTDFQGGVNVLRFEESLPVAYRHAEEAMAGVKIVDPEAEAAPGE